VAEVLPVEHHDVLEAKNIAATHPGLSARDSLHVAIMRRHGVWRILTFDRGFDRVSGIERIPA
jgi:predicted nucleic acid-binding protein